MHPSPDGEFEEMVHAWFCINASNLDETLRENGFDDAAARRAAVTQFMSTLGTLLEQGWFETTSGRRVHPWLCFLDAPLSGQAESATAATKIFLPDALPFSFSEPAISNCFHLYEENPAAGREIRQGVIGPDE